MIDAEKIVSNFCRAHDLKIQFSTDMPAGCETANGTFDISKNTLFLNTAALANMPFLSMHLVWNAPETLHCLRNIQNISGRLTRKQ